MHSFIAVVEGTPGKLKTRLEYPTAWQLYIMTNYKPGDRIWIYSKKYYKPRSTGKDPKTGKECGNQNGYYWAVVLADIAAHTGHTPHEIHEEMKALHNPVASRINPERTVAGSTENMNTVEFEEYLERIRVWAIQELDLTIPLPNETPEAQDDEEEPEE